MDVKERVRVNIYKQLLEEEKKKSKMFKKSMLSVLVLFMLSIPVFNTINSNGNNVKMLSNVNQSDSILKKYTNSTDEVYTYTKNETKDNIEGNIFNISSTKDTNDYGQTDLYNDLFGL